MKLHAPQCLAADLVSSGHFSIGEVLRLSEEYRAQRVDLHCHRRVFLVIKLAFRSHV